MQLESQCSHHRLLQKCLTLQLIQLGRKDGLTWDAVREKEGDTAVLGTGKMERDGDSEANRTVCALDLFHN